MIFRVLAVGDVVGESGVDFLAKKLRQIKKEKSVDFTVVNGENADLIGIKPNQADDIFSAGADVITLGNHTFGRDAIHNYLDENRYILRPANYAPQNPGRGWGEFESKCGEVCVINLIGRCDMAFGTENPFLGVDKILKETRAKIILVDFHASATSEKLAMGYYLDGRATALWGTHTHVQTSDAMVFEKGLGYITDAGMTGPVQSVIGIIPEQSVEMFRGSPRSRFQLAGGRCKLEAVLFEIDTETGKCSSAEALRYFE